MTSTWTAKIAITKECNYVKVHIMIASLSNRHSDPNYCITSIINMHTNTYCILSSFLLCYSSTVNL